MNIENDFGHASIVDHLVDYVKPSPDIERGGDANHAVPCRPENSLREHLISTRSHSIGYFRFEYVIRMSSMIHIK